MCEFYCSSSMYGSVSIYVYPINNRKPRILFPHLLTTGVLRLWVFDIQSREGWSGQEKIVSGHKLSSSLRITKWTDRSLWGLRLWSPAGWLWQLRSASPSGYLASCSLDLLLSLLVILMSSLLTASRFARIGSNADFLDRFIFVAILSKDGVNS